MFKSAQTVHKRNLELKSLVKFTEFTNITALVQDNAWIIVSTNTIPEFLQRSLFKFTEKNKARSNLNFVCCIFDQRLGDAHHRGWLKYAFSTCFARKLRKL